MIKKQSDSLSIKQNSDGSFSMDWDPKDPNWSWLNDLTSDQIKVIIQQAIKEYDG